MKTKKVPLSPEEYEKQLEQNMRISYAGKSVEYDDRVKLTKSIEKTFFNGSMPFKFFQVVDDLIDNECMTAMQIYYVFYDSYHKKTRKRPFHDCTESWFQPSIKKAKRLKRLLMTTASRDVNKQNNKDDIEYYI